MNYGSGLGLRGNRFPIIFLSQGMHLRTRGGPQRDPRRCKVLHIFDRGARAPQGHDSGPSQATAGRGRDTVRVTSDQMTWVFFTSATGCF